MRQIHTWNNKGDNSDWFGTNIQSSRNLEHRKDWKAQGVYESILCIDRPAKWKER